jgi:hypothetical protein
VFTHSSLLLQASSISLHSLMSTQPRFLTNLVPSAHFWLADAGTAGIVVGLLVIGTGCFAQL